MYSLDSLFEKLGLCGRFQVIFVSLGYFPLLPAAWGLMLMVFGNYNPGMECVDDSLLNDTNLPELAGNITQMSPQREGNFTGQGTSPCTCDSIKSHPNWIFNNGTSTVVTEFSLVCDDSWKSSTIISMQMLGVLFGSFSGGSIGDRFGRKFSIHGGSAMLALTNIIAIFSFSWAMYAVVIFFIGFASGCVLSTATVYNMEFIPSFWRAFLGTFPFWSVTSILLGACVMALKNWRHIHIATAFVAVLAFLPVFYLPESMRFLTVHGHLKRANNVVKKIATLNKKPAPDTTIITKIAKIEKEALKERSSYTYLDLFHKSVRKYTIVLWLTWFILSVSNNTIGFGLKAFAGDFFVNLLVYFSLPFPARTLNIITTVKLGRKTALATSVCLACVCAFLVVIIELTAATDKEDITTTALALLLNMFVESGWGVTTVYIPELFPTDVRNKSVGFCCAAARIGAVVAAFLNPKQSLPMWGVFLLIGILLLICFLSVLTLPESKGRPLRENLQQKRTESKDSAVTSHA